MKLQKIVIIFLELKSINQDNENMEATYFTFYCTLDIYTVFPTINDYFNTDATTVT